MVRWQNIDYLKKKCSLKIRGDWKHLQWK